MKLRPRAAFVSLTLAVLISACVPACGQYLWNTTYQFFPSEGYCDDGTLYYLMTDCSDQSYAYTFNVNYTPKLANALSPLIRTSAGEFMPRLYYVTNYQQPLVFESQWTGGAAPYKPSPRDYIPLWRLQEVTWNDGTDPVDLTSADEIETMSGQPDPEITVTDVAVVVGASIIINTLGEKPASAFVYTRYGSPMVRMTIRQLYIDGVVYKMAQLDFSNTYAARTNKGIYAPLLSKFNMLRQLGQPLASQRIYNFWPVPPVRQLYVAQDAPSPFGPGNQNGDYSPLMNEYRANTWRMGVLPIFTSEAAILAAPIPVYPTNYMSYQPVLGI